MMRDGYEKEELTFEPMQDSEKKRGSKVGRSSSRICDPEIDLLFTGGKECGSISKRHKFGTFLGFSQRPKELLSLRAAVEPGMWDEYKPWVLLVRLMFATPKKRKE